MRCLFKSLLLTVLLLLASYAQAATDPISWTLDRPFQNPVTVGRTYFVFYTFTNQLPLTLAKPLVIDKSSTNPDEFFYIDACSGMRLGPHANCVVLVELLPLVAGRKSVQLTIAGYDNNRVPLPALTTIAEGTGPTTAVYATVDQSFPANLSVGQPYTYSFTYTNRGSETVTGASVGVTQTSGAPNFTTTCSTSLEAGKSCSITGSYTPTSATPTTQTVTGTFSYDSSQSVSASTSGSVTSSSGVIASYVTPYYLPAEMVGGPSDQKTIVARFFNNTGGDITVTSRSLSITTGGASGTLTLDTSPANDNCMLSAGTGSKVLPNGGACIITGTFEGNVVVSDTQVVITGDITYTGAAGSPSSIATSTYLVPSLSTSRTITLVNDCDFPVWFSLHGGALGGSPVCPAASCPAGTSCDQDNHVCFWNNRSPNTGSSFQLTANGGSNTVTIPFNSGTDPAILWSGVISASLRCDPGLANCIVAPCNNSDGTTACAVGQGFNGPATQAEFTFNLTTSDSYDVEVINGFHIPISITPTSHTTPSDYTCGVAGGFTADNNFGSCDWDSATPPGNGYYIVTSGGASCNITSPSCPASNQICGIALDLVNNSVNMSCGAFLGYWTATEICGLHPAKGSTVETYFHCTTLLGGNFPANSTFYDLMKCSVPTGDTSPPFNTCYSAYPSSTPAEQNQIAQCCGCKDWWTAGIGANPNTASCTQSSGYVNTDPTWNTNIQTTVQWLKAACPSAYVYPFDDKTSGFSCSNNLPGSSNSTNYTITFCAGNTGLPGGKLDGRKNPPSFHAIK